MKRTLIGLCISIWLVAGAARAQAQANSAANWQASYLQGFKEQISLPPEIVAFINFKEQQANDIVRKSGFELDADFKNFFAAAKAGHAREAQQLMIAFRQFSYATNLTPAQKSPLRQVAVDVALAYLAFNGTDRDLVFTLGNDLIQSLPTNCIYFGGTDAGRGLPTMLCKAPGDPIFVISQNPLADSRYRQYLREMYDTRIQIPTTNEFQEIINVASNDVQRRIEHDQNFPNEPKQVRLDETVMRPPDGKLSISVNAIGAQLTKAIFDKNPDRESYYEQSFPIDWMYPYLSPHGAVLKINRQPLDTIPADDVKADEEYWKRQVTAKLGDWFAKDSSLSNICAVLEKLYARNDLSDFKGDARYIHSDYIQAAYSNLRSSIAGVYDWRFKHSKSSAEKQLFAMNTELAHREAFALSPYQPTVVYSYVNFLTQMNLMDAALLVAKTAEACAPKSDTQRFARLVENMEKMKARKAGSTTKP